MITRSLGISSVSFLAIVLTASSAGAQSTPTGAQDKPGTAQSGDASGKGTEGAAGAGGAVTGTTRPIPPLVEPPSYESKSTDVTEQPGKTYYYLGLRYRGTIIPKFMENLFVDEGATIYSNTIGLELDMRKDGFSLIPAISYTEYGTDNILFLEKGKDPGLAGNWNNIKSSLKGLYATADLLWSIKVAKNVDFEYGAGFGIGYIFGDLETSWVYQDQNGPYQTSGGQRFSPCTTATATKVGCQSIDHQNSEKIKINHYVEPSWFDGGSRPNIFLHLAIPQFGIRVKPVKEFQARLGIGFSLTGFWFGLSGDYGLERALEKKKAP